MKYFCRFILRLLHYNITLENLPPEAQKCVLIFAPHTSWLDFIIGKMSLTAMGVPTTFLMKKEAFVFPVKYILLAIGAYPVDRQNPRHFTDNAVQILNSHTQMALLIAPEGTRKKVNKWKRGFYTIALEAGVPFTLGFLDYKSRRGGIGGVYYPTGDYEKDLAEIQKFYAGMQGRRKGCFNLEDEPYAHPDWLQKM